MNPTEIKLAAGADKPVATATSKTWLERLPGLPMGTF